MDGLTFTIIEGVQIRYKYLFFLTTSLKCFGTNIFLDEAVNKKNNFYFLSRTLAIIFLLESFQTYCPIKLMNCLIQQQKALIIRYLLTIPLYKTRILSKKFSLFCIKNCYKKQILFVSFPYPVSSVNNRLFYDFSTRPTKIEKELTLIN